MNQIMLAAVCRYILGPKGHRNATFGDIHTAYTQVIFADYFRYNPYVSAKTLYKYTNCTSPYPHFLTNHYGGPNGYRRTLGDMMGVVDRCPSITQVWEIQDGIHHWVSTHLPPETAQTLSKHYVNQNTDRREIAVFISNVMHHAVTTTPK